MSFEINGTTWEPETATEHCEAILTEVNRLLQVNNIKDKSGNVIQLKQNYGNAFYLLGLGDGNRFAENDEKLTKAINSFNVELCDDTQIENLLPIAAITRNPGSYSTLRLTVTASEDGTCTIPAGTRAPYGSVYFVTQTATVLSAGATQVIDTVCDTVGSIAVLTGEVTSFETEIANLETVINNESSVPGVAPETTDELRQRLIKGDTIKYSLDGCQNALEELTGITYARVYFNYNSSSTITLPGGVVLQPRTAYIVVQGSSSDLASTYAEYMNAPTQNSPIGEGAYSTVGVKITATNDGSATIPAGTTVTYESKTYSLGTGATIAAGQSQTLTFTCTVWGPNNIPSYGIEELDQTITNVDSAYNPQPAVPGRNDPKHSQNWVTASGQTIPIKYDDAIEKNVFVKIYLKEDADSGDQVTNQLKRDLIVASAGWTIGEAVTQINTCAPFVDCSYTEVAYTEVSLNGTTWAQFQSVGCNEVPRVTDATISVVQLGD